MQLCGQAAKINTTDRKKGLNNVDKPFLFFVGVVVVVVVWGGNNSQKKEKSTGSRALNFVCFGSVSQCQKM